MSCDVRSSMDNTLNSSMDEEGNLILALERKSVKPFKTQDEYLYAMKEDLADWFSTLYTELPINVDNFFEELETGVILCRHANTVQNFIRDSYSAEPSRSYDNHPHQNHHHSLLQQPASLINGTRSSSPFFSPRNPTPSRPPLSRNSSTDSESEQPAVVFRKSAKPGSFQSRDNVSNFLSWCRASPVSIPDTLLFETEDLVSRKNERNVVLCLLEVARRGAKYGVLAPTIIQLEAEIDREIAEENDDPGPLPPPIPTVKRKPVDMMSLDEMVRSILGECTCPDQFPMIRVSEGKYKIGDNETLIFVRILRNHVMVRIGGGWDTLENYLDRHDPCRCQVKGHGKGHKGQRGHGGSFVQRNRRVSAPAKTGGPPADKVTADKSGANNCEQPTAASSPRKDPSTVTSSRQPTHRSSTATCPVNKSTEFKMPGQLEKSSRLQAAQNGRNSPSPYQMRPSSPAPGRRSPAPTHHRPSSPAPSGRSSPSPHKMRPSSPSPVKAKWAEPSHKPRRESTSSVNSEEQFGVERSASPKPGRARQAFTNDGRFSTERPASPKLGRVRPSSARERKVSEFSPRDKNGLASVHDDDRDRARSKTREVKTRRSSSVGGDDVQRQSLSKTAPSPLVRQNACDRNTTISKSNSFMIKRDSSGRHRIDTQEENEDPPPKKMPPARVPLTPDKMFSTMPKLRSQNSDESSKEIPMRTPKKDTGNASKGKTPLRATHSVSHSKTIDVLSSTNDEIDVGAPASKVSNLVAMKPKSASSFSLNTDYDDYPEAPPAEEDLNAHMELLFEEYKKIEKASVNTNAESKDAPKSADKKKSSTKEIKTTDRDRGRSSTQGKPSARSRSLTREAILSKTAPVGSLTVSTHVKKELTPTVHKRAPSPGPQRRMSLVKSNSAGSSISKPAQSSTTPSSSKLQKDKRNTENTPAENKANPPARRSGLSTVVATGNVASQTQRKAVARSASLGRMSFRSKAPEKDSVGDSKPIKRHESEENLLSVAPRTGRLSRSDSVKTREAGLLKQTLTAKGPGVARKAGVTAPSAKTVANAADDAAKPELAQVFTGPKRNTSKSVTDSTERARGKLVRTSSNSSINHRNVSSRQSSKSPTSVACNGASAPPLHNGDLPNETSILHQSNVVHSSTHRPHDLDVVSNCSSVSESPVSQAKVRKDNREGPRTKIPMPVEMKNRIKAGYSVGSLPSNLKRFDSGVDITNLSPSETSCHGDDEPHWLKQRSLSPPPALSYNVSDSHDLENDDEYY